MGARYFLMLDCPRCGARNADIYFAPTCNMASERCHGCRETFYIGDDFAAHKEPQIIDMRKHSTFGNNFEKVVGAPALQRVPE